MWLTDAVISTPEDPWIVFTAIATGAAAIATAFSAIFIAFQAAYTRQSVQKTSEALQVAQTELDQNALVFIDAQKARIDGEMPRLTVFPVDVRTERPIGTGTLRPGERFGPDDDTRQRLTMVLTVSVMNDGPRLARVDLASSQGNLESDSVTIGIGKRVDVPIRITRTLNEWMKLSLVFGGFEQSQNERATRRSVLELTHRFPGDIGADELHVADMRGSVLHAVNGVDFELAANDLNSDADFEILPLPFVRAYWQSRTADRRL